MWSYGGVRIYASSDTGKIPEWRIDEVDPIDQQYATTFVHQAGRESYTRKITATVMDGNFDAFIFLVDGAAHALITDQGSEGNWVIMDYSARRKQALNKSDVVLEVNIELMEA